MITRVFDASRDLVFDVWTKEEHLSKWWGPQGFTMTIQQFDMKPGGTWEFIMLGPDGVDFSKYQLTLTGNVGSKSDSVKPSI